MNPDNRASLPASRRLVQAGIVLETEAVWVDTIRWRWQLIYRVDVKNHAPYREMIPAPSMAEVWRELPFGCYIQQVENGFVVGMDDGERTIHIRRTVEANPTDALIDLLIWTRKAKAPKAQEADHV